MLLLPAVCYSSNILFFDAFCKIFNVEVVIKKENGYDKLKGMFMFEIEHVSVP